MKIILLIIMLFSVFVMRAQEIKGRVIETVNGQKYVLPGASVYWEATNDGVATDENGNFSIQWNKTGKLVVSFIGYQTDTVVVKKSQKNLEIVLQAGAMLDEVTASARRTSTIVSTKGPIIEQVITGDELCKAACCNLGESFTTNAAVDVSYADAVTGAKQIEMLGLTGKYVQMMTENMPNFRGISSLYGLNYIPGAWMSSISVSKGTGSVINGYEAIAGQISVDYKKPLTSEKFFVNTYANDEGMVELNMNTGIKLSDKWSTALLVHGDRMQSSHDPNEDGFLDMPKQKNYNVMSRWQFKNDDWNIQFGGKYIDETREGGQTMHGNHAMKEETDTMPLYTTEIANRRGEAFVKIGYLMPQYENTSMALVLNFTSHKQDARYGLRNYNARQNNLTSNYIFQSVFGGNEDQAFSAGLSFSYDFLDERFNEYFSDIQLATNQKAWNRDEITGGAFFQYTGHFWEKLTVMAGIRYDQHNYEGGFLTPRMHISYAPNEMTRIKFSAGSGARTAHVLADNSYLLASSNRIYVNGEMLINNPDVLKNLNMERAWNFGAQINRKFYLWGRLLNINLDYFRTTFTDQVVVDNEHVAGKINFYNLDGKSYSNCYQAEIKYELIPRLDMTVAYRYNDVKSTIDGKLKMAPLLSRYKSLVNLSYATNMRKWQFDFTALFNGSGRIPVATPASAEAPELASSFDAYQIMNAQVTKFFRMWSIYVGSENICDFTQKNPIIAANDPWGAHFDASKIWGPVQGRKFYVGLRFALNRD